MRLLLIVANSLFMGLVTYGVYMNSGIVAEYVFAIAVFFECLFFTHVVLRWGR